MNAIIEINSYNLARGRVKNMCTSRFHVDYVYEEEYLVKFTYTIKRFCKEFPNQVIDRVFEYKGEIV